MIRKSLTTAALVAGFVFSTAVFAQVPRVSNTIKYKDTGVRPATGRSGNASIEARALRAKDGQVVLDVTTGTFDGGAAPGNIDRMKVKIAGIATTFDGTGGGTMSVPLGIVPWHEPVEVQANISGIDPRVDVVDATDLVRLRPDLVAGSVTGAIDALAGMPVTYTAAVKERNGDVGARANCALSVDSDVVDRSDGIWVDANGTVSCTFAHTFASAGTKSVSISVTGVSPADYDDGNNSSTATVRVYDHASEMQQFYAEAEDVSFDFWLKGTSATREDFSSQKGWQDNDLFIGWIVGDLDFRNSAIHVIETSEGRLISDTSGKIDHFRGDWWSGSTCGSYFHGWAFVDACQYDGMSGRTTRVGWQRYSGDITYHSEGWSNRYDPYENPGGGYYTWNTTFRAQNGVQERIGSQVSLDVTYGDGVNLWRATPSYALESSTRALEMTFCDPAPWFTCYTYHFDEQWKKGRAGGWFE